MAGGAPAKGDRERTLRDVWGDRSTAGKVVFVALPATAATLGIWLFQGAGEIHPLRFLLTVGIWSGFGLFHILYAIMREDEETGS